jgi:hypothetical protein
VLGLFVAISVVEMPPRLKEPLHTLHTLLQAAIILSVTFTVAFHAGLPGRELRGPVRRAARAAQADSPPLRAENIDIPFPVRTIEVRGPDADRAAGSVPAP